MKHEPLYPAVISFAVAARSVGAAHVANNLKVCFSRGDCVSMLMVPDYYLGYTGPKMNTEWRLTVDAWTMEKLQLSGLATLHEGGGVLHSDEWIIKVAPDVIKDGIARGKAKDISDHDKKADTVTVTWEPYQAKVYGSVVR